MGCGPSKSTAQTAANTTVAAAAAKPAEIAKQASTVPAIAQPPEVSKQASAVPVIAPHTAEVSKQPSAVPIVTPTPAELSKQPSEIPQPAAAISKQPSAVVEEQSPVERTLALIKPDVYPAKKDEIMEKIRADGFTVVVEREVHFDKDKAAEFYKEHLGKGFYEELTTAPIYAIVLEKEGAIKAWRALAGPTNSNKAREEHPQSIRALFGTDGSLNAVHGSDSPASAEREIGVVFGAEVSSHP
ncbi:nucleoside diphosphate kinase [Rhizoclosmatium globosum]|uniref:Nucleoside diphosphate kinase n=1 Tax=Rhizoclosmatium globosum TaxID=329046 RepID=A0A1Y2BMN8_9FUNG|nr:nucleoside diphosphate kinase [Rhizoclosmatium globosum]|eukprot:ORY36018.1 nucleoside diphosphate kinase [Rhizoclosmatium globosum]